MRNPAHSTGQPSPAWLQRVLSLCALSASLCLARPGYASSCLPQVKTVFIILEENHAWSLIQGDTTGAPYINNTLLPMASSCSNYWGGTLSGTPGALHPSLPNYLWLDAGTNFGFTSDEDPTSSYLINSTQHLETLLNNAGLTWRDYAEGVSAGTCPLSSGNEFTPHHLAALYFTDDTGPNPPNADSPYCVANIVPYTQLASDLTNNACADYNFIDPNQDDDMHSGTIQEADTWLSTAIPAIMASQAYQDNGAIIITWDEAYNAAGDETTAPIGLILLSPLAKGGGYVSSVALSHSSTLRTVEEIFNLSPLLGDAANATDLSDLFSNACTGYTPTDTMTPTASPSSSATGTATPTATGTPTITATPTITLTATSSPTVTATPTATPSPSVTPTDSPTPTVTATPTTTPSPSVTPTDSPTPTVTATPTVTLTFNSAQLTAYAPAYNGSTLGRIVLGPDPIRPGQNLNIYFAQAPADCSAQVFDLAGRCVFQAAFSDPGFASLPTANWSAGIYFVRLRVDGATVWQKVAVIH